MSGENKQQQMGEWIVGTFLVYNEFTETSRVSGILTHSFFQPHPDAQRLQIQLCHFIIAIVPYADIIGWSHYPGAS